MQNNPQVSWIVKAQRAKQSAGILLNILPSMKEFCKKLSGEIMRLDKSLIKDTYLNQVKEKWLQYPSSFPTDFEVVAYQTKIDNSQYLKTCIERLNKQLNKIPTFTFIQKRWQRKTFKMIWEVLNTETIMNTHRALSSDTIKDFVNELQNFLRLERQFSPDLSLEDAGQAIRNYVVYMMFEEMNRHPVEKSSNSSVHKSKSRLNIAAFGYSMLYPFTDNYIDDVTLCVEKKQQYNQLIKDKLEGKTVIPKCEYEKKTCQLLQMIEDSYSRNEDNTIFTLLLMMLEAQELSLLQQNIAVSSPEEDRLSISLYKGGISVLIDRFLINREFTEQDLFFYFGFGFFLQLADDLQDIESDKNNGHHTLFTLDTGSIREEALVNQLLHFVTDITNSYLADNNVFKEFVLYSCQLLIYSSAINSRKFFSDEYINRLETLLPVFSSDLDSMKKSISGKKPPMDSLKMIDILIKNNNFS